MTGFSNMCLCYRFLDFLLAADLLSTNVYPTKLLSPSLTVDSAANSNPVTQFITKTATCLHLQAEEGVSLNTHSLYQHHHILSISYIGATFITMVVVVIIILLLPYSVCFEDFVPGIVLISSHFSRHKVPSRQTQTIWLNHEVCVFCFAYASQCFLTFCSY